jgi:hypothetical protein
MSTQQLFSSLESKYKLPEGYLARVYQLESSSGKNLYNKDSGATGPFQFMPRTARSMGLQDPNDLTQSAEAAARLAAENREYMRKNGVEEVDGKLLFLAHNQGAAGAIRLLKNPDKPAAELLGERAVVLNAGKADQPAGQFAQQLMGKYEGGGSQRQAQQPYSALGTSEPVSERAQAAPAQETPKTEEEDPKAARRRLALMNALAGLSKGLQQEEPPPFLPIRRLSYADGGIVSLVKDEAPQTAALRREAERVAQAGRGNDTVLAHINPLEAALLKKMGGSGTVNPRTGLLEFEDGGGDGGDGGDGSDGGGDGGDGGDGGWGSDGGWGNGWSDGWSDGWNGG